MLSKIGKWGGSNAIRLPKAAMKKLGLKEGTELEISVEKGAIIARPVKAGYVLDDLVKAAKNLERPDLVDDKPVGSEWPEH